MAPSSSSGASTEQSLSARPTDHESRRHAPRQTQGNPDDITVEDITDHPTESGYEGDADVRHPDEYDEPESSFDHSLPRYRGSSASRPSSDADSATPDPLERDRVADRIRRLRIERDTPNANPRDPGDSDHGNKRAHSRSSTERIDDAAQDSADVSAPLRQRRRKKKRPSEEAEMQDGRSEDAHMQDERRGRAKTDPSRWKELRIDPPSRNWSPSDFEKEMRMRGTPTNNLELSEAMDIG